MIPKSFIKMPSKLGELIKPKNCSMFRAMHDDLHVAA